MKHMEKEFAFGSQNVLEQLILLLRGQFLEKFTFHDALIVVIEIRLDVRLHQFEICDFDLFGANEIILNHKKAFHFV